MNDKRPWFRFHLLTAVLMMVGAGTMLWINTRRDYWHEPNGWHIEWGWPLRTLVQVKQPVGTVFNEYVYTVPYVSPNTDWRVVALNAVIAIGIVVILGVLSEYFIRRREARKL